MKMFWNTQLDGWILWGVWIQRRWFIGCSRVAAGETNR